MRHLLTVILILALSVAACSRRDRQLDAALDRVEAIMDTDPGTALAMLDSVSRIASPLDSAVHPATRAHYALLLSRVYDKNCIDFTSDSIASIAANYYIDTDDLFHRMLANYSRGRVLYNAGDYSRALVSFLDAEEDALSLDNKYYLGLIYQNLSAIYGESNNVTEELSYARQSHDILLQIASTHYLNYCFSVLFLANSYHNSADYTNSLILVDSVFALNAELNDAELDKGALHQKATSLYGLNDYKGSIEAFSKFMDLYPDEMSDKDYALLGRCYIIEGDIEKGRFYQNKVQNITPFYSWCDYDVYRNSGDYKSALDAAYKEYSYLNTLCYRIMTSNLSRTALDYQANKRTIAEEKARTRKVLTLYIVSICVIAVIVIVVVTYRKIKNREQKIIEKQLYIESLYNEYNSVSTSLSESQNFIGDLIRRKIFNINLSAKKYKNTKELLIPSKRFVKEISSDILSFISDEKIYAEFTRIIDRENNNIYSRFISQLPNISQNDRNLFIYFVGGLSMTTIALLVDESTNAIYQRKFRLREKILSSETKDRVEFADFLSNNKS